MSRNTQNVAKIPLKPKTDEQLLERLENPVPISAQRRLKKINQVNQSQQLLPRAINNQEQPLFRFMDDGQIQRQRDVGKAVYKQGRQKSSFQSKLHSFALLKQQKRLGYFQKQKKLVQGQVEKSDQQGLHHDSIQTHKLFQAEKPKKYTQMQDQNENNYNNQFNFTQRTIGFNSHKYFNDYPITAEQLNKPIIVPNKKCKIQAEDETQKGNKANIPTNYSDSKKAEKAVKQGPFKGLQIAFTGVYTEYDRDKVIEVCEQLGAHCLKDITKKCNLLLQGEYAVDNFGRRQNVPIQQTKKSKQAVTRGIKVIDYKSLSNFFIQKTGFPLQHHIDKNKVVPPNQLTYFFDQKPPLLQCFYPQQNITKQQKDKNIEKPNSFAQRRREIIDYLLMAQSDEQAYTGNKLNVITKSAQTNKAEKPINVIKRAQKAVKQGPFKGLQIAFTGVYAEYDRDKVIEVCEQLGAHCLKDITKKCNLLLQGEYAVDNFGRRQNVPIQQTKKSKQAVTRGIKVIDYKSLSNFFIQKTGFPLQHHIDKNKVVPPNQLTYFFDQKSSLNRITNPVKIEFQRVYQKPVQISLPITADKQPPVDKPIIRANKPITADKHPPVDKLIPADNQLWIQKHKPTSLQNITGQQSQIKQLRQWLQAWDDIHINGNQREMQETKSRMPGGSINSNAVLLSGASGIGKTIAAKLLADQYNYKVSQFNASDVRNESKVTRLQSGSYHIDSAKKIQKSLIIMDEVDGMSFGDRGGIASIIKMIKNTKVPIICICNDRYSAKIRTLANHCLDIKFHKPNKLQIAKMLKQILVSEGGTGEDRALQQLVETFQNDIRHILNYLQIVFKTVSKKITVDALKNRFNFTKDTSVMINSFQAARRLMNRSQFDGLKITERVQCFFVDSEKVPLIIQQNILNSASKKNFDNHKMHKMVQGLKGLVVGDMLDGSVRKEQAWGLIPSYAFMNSVYSTEKISESLGFPASPAWFQTFSSYNKKKRLAKQVKNNFFCVSLCANWSIIKHQFCPILIHQLIELLKFENIHKAVKLMQHYQITPLTLNSHLISTQYTQDKSNPFSIIPAATKAKLTKLFNSRHKGISLQQTYKTKRAYQNGKFDPVLEMVQQQYQEAQSEQEQGNVAENKPRQRL